MLFTTIIALVSLGQAHAGNITNGRFQSPNGVKVELIGFANADTGMGPVFGANGKPLGIAETREFVRASEERSYARAKASQEAPRRWLVIFRVIGPREETHQVKFGLSFRPSMMGYMPADPARGIDYLGIKANAYHPASGPFLDIPFTMPAGAYRKIADFDEDGMTFAEATFVQLKKSKLDAYAATEKESRAFTMDGYQGSALIPLKLKGMEFDLKGSDQQVVRKGPPDPTADGYAGAVETGLEDGQLKLLLFARLPKASSRSFSLYARPTLSFTMRLRLPTRP